MIDAAGQILLALGTQLAPQPYEDSQWLCKEGTCRCSRFLVYLVVKSETSHACLDQPFTAGPRVIHDARSVGLEEPLGVLVCHSCAVQRDILFQKRTQGRLPCTGLG